WCRTYHLSNGVNGCTFHPDRRTAAARATLGPADSCVAFYAGLHGLAQGLEHVLTAAELLADTPLHFVLMGDGPTKAELMRQARSRGLNNVTFLDPRPTLRRAPVQSSRDRRPLRRVPGTAARAGAGRSRAAQPCDARRGDLSPDQRALSVLMLTSEWPREADHTAHFVQRQVRFLEAAGVRVEVFPFRGAGSPLRYAAAWLRARRDRK